MKIRFGILYAVVLSVILLACATGESETLMQARSIQNEMLREADVLDSNINVQIMRVNDELTTMSNDTLLMNDSTRIGAYMAVKTRYNDLNELQSGLADWRSNVKLLPTAEEIDNGAENPFGEKARDQEILAEIKKSKEEFDAFKSQAEARMK